ncbi:MAG: hypothetical protein V1753_07100 [Pseudomonadota bacterium]
MNASDNVSLLPYKVYVREMNFTHFVAAMSIYFNAIPANQHASKEFRAPSQNPGERSGKPIKLMT